MKQFWWRIWFSAILFGSLAACGLLRSPSSDPTRGPISEYNMSLADTGYPELYQEALDFMRVGRYAEAEELYLHLLDLEPRNANAAIGLGASLLLQDKLERSLEAYQRAVEFAPQSLQAHIGMGSAAYQLGQLEMASQQYRLALDLDDQNMDALWGLVITLEASGRRREAVEFLERIINIEPQSAYAEAALEKLDAFSSDTNTD